MDGGNSDGIILGGKAGGVRKRGVRVLVSVICGFVILIGILLMAFLINDLINVKKSDERTLKTRKELSAMVAEYSLNQDKSGIDLDELIENLRYAIEQEEDWYDKSLDCIDLSLMESYLENGKSPTSIIDWCLGLPDITDEARYNLLGQKVIFAQGDEEIIEIYEEIIGLPENMKLRYLDWPEVRQYYIDIVDGMKEGVMIYEE